MIADIIALFIIACSCGVATYGVLRLNREMAGMAKALHEERHRRLALEAWLTNFSLRLEIVERGRGTLFRKQAS